jgi:ATP-dependent Clp protease ATP-binding subunit ClpB
VFFKSLSEEDIQQIARIQLKLLQQRLASKNITLTITENVVKEVALRGYSKEFGARPLKREIQNFITMPISQFLLANPKVTALKTDVSEGTLVIVNESVTAPL